jgi:hypothetical protein
VRIFMMHHTTAWVSKLERALSEGPSEPNGCRLFGRQSDRLWIAALAALAISVGVPSQALAVCTVSPAAHENGNLILGAQQNRLTFTVPTTQDCTGLPVGAQLSIKNEANVELAATVRAVSQGVVTIATVATPVNLAEGPALWRFTGAIEGAAELIVSRPRISFTQRRNPNSPETVVEREGEQWQFWARAQRQSNETLLRASLPVIPYRMWCVSVDVAGISTVGNTPKEIGPLVTLVVQPVGATTGTIKFFTSPISPTCPNPAAAQGSSEFQLSVPLSAMARRTSYPIEFVDADLNPPSGTPGSPRLVIACDRATVDVTRNGTGVSCTEPPDGPFVVGSGGAIAPSRLSTCAIRYYPQCGSTAPNNLLLEYGYQRIRLVVRRGNEEVYVRYSEAFSPAEFRQFPLSFGDGNTDSEYSVFVYLAKDGGVSYATPPPETPVFTATVRPQGNFSVWCPTLTRHGVRVFVTVPVSPLTLRFPRHPANTTSSAESSVVEVTAVRSGLLVGVEPWNYQERRALLPMRILGGGIASLDSASQFQFSFALGVAFRLPLIDSNSQLGTAATLGAFLELTAPTQGLTAWSPRVVVSTSIDLGSIFSPSTRRTE